MEPQEARKIVVDDIRVIYGHAWTQFAFIKDEHARVRAINGVMITIDKVWPFLAPKDSVPAQTPVGPSKPSAETPVTPPTSKPAPIPAHAPPASQPTTPAAPPVKDEQPAPSMIEGEPAYDRTKLRWNKCPTVGCGNTDLDAETEKTNPKTGKVRIRKYQACFECRIFLNFDGKIVPMTPQEAKA
jgi:hypothetical protein